MHATEQVALAQRAGSLIQCEHRLHEDPRERSRQRDGQREDRREAEQLSTQPPVGGSQRDVAGDRDPNHPIVLGGAHEGAKPLIAFEGRHERADRGGYAGQRGHQRWEVAHRVRRLQRQVGLARVGDKPTVPIREEDRLTGPHPHLFVLVFEVARVHRDGDDADRASRIVADGHAHHDPVPPRGAQLDDVRDRWQVRGHCLPEVRAVCHGERRGLCVHRGTPIGTVGPRRVEQAEGGHLGVHGDQLLQIGVHPGGVEGTHPRIERNRPPDAHGRVELPVYRDRHRVGRYQLILQKGVLQPPDIASKPPHEQSQHREERQREAEEHLPLERDRHLPGQDEVCNQSANARRWRLRPSPRVISSHLVAMPRTAASTPPPCPISVTATRKAAS